MSVPMLKNIYVSSSPAPSVPLRQRQISRVSFTSLKKYPQTVKASKDEGKETETAKQKTLDMRDVAKDGADTLAKETNKAVDQAEEKAEEIKKTSQSVEEKVVETTENLSTTAAESLQGAWELAKETSDKIKNDIK